MQTLAGKFLSRRKTPYVIYMATSRLLCAKTEAYADEVDLQVYLPGLPSKSTSQAYFAGYFLGLPQVYLTGIHRPHEAPHSSKKVISNIGTEILLPQCFAIFYNELVCKTMIPELVGSKSFTDKEFNVKT